MKYQHFDFPTLKALSPEGYRKLKKMHLKLPTTQC